VSHGPGSIQATKSTPHGEMPRQEGLALKVLVALSSWGGDRRSVEWLHAATRDLDFPVAPEAEGFESVPHVFADDSRTELPLRKVSNGCQLDRDVFERLRHLDDVGIGNARHQTGERLRGGVPRRLELLTEGRLGHVFDSELLATEPLVDSNSSRASPLEGGYIGRPGCGVDGPLTPVFSRRSSSS
jgi:hypothetical protein